MKKTVLVVIIAWSMISGLFLYGCTQIKTSSSSKKTSVEKSYAASQVSIKNAFEELKQYLKKNGMYDSYYDSYKIESQKSLNDLCFSISYYSEDEHISIYANNSDTKDLCYIYLYPNKTTVRCAVMCTILSDDDYVAGVIESINMSDISSKSNRMLFDSYERITVEANNTRNEQIEEYLPINGASIIKQALMCYEYEQSRQNIPVSLKMLGFVNYN